MQHHINRVSISGRLHGELSIITNQNGDTFFDGILAVQRTSGTFDYLPITIPAKLVGGEPGKTMGSMVKVTELYGRRLRMDGELMSYNKDVQGKSRHYTTLLVCNIMDEGKPGDYNLVELQGVICRAPSFRETPFGREICDFMVAINRSGGQSAYIPCIAWGMTARDVSAMEVGTKVALKGRFQSREYQKKLDNGEKETRTTYEVSCKHVDAVEVREEWVNGSV